MKQMTETIAVFINFNSEEEAIRIARSLVEEHLAACANILSPVRSIYRWEGKILDEKEWTLILKTQRKRFEELEQKVKSLHSYSIPEIIAFPITEGSSSYLKWVEEMTDK
jgi:periplasmic divalent cation tolerance protein